MRKYFILRFFLLSASILLLINCVIYPQNNINNKIRLAQTYERQGDYDRAKEIYLELLSSQPWNLQLIQPLNNIYLRQKDYDSSINLLQSQINRSPADPTFYGLLGTTYYTMGNSEKAFEVWDTGIEVNPQNISAYRIIANHVIENRAFDKGIDIMKRGKAVGKNSLIFSFDLANIYSITMKYEEAANEYCEILLLQPTQIGSVKNRIANYINNHGAFESTVEVINRYIEEDGSSMFLDLLAFLYIQNDDFDNAFEITLRLDGELKNEGASLFTFAKTAQSEKQFKAAARAYDTIIEKYPSSTFVPSARISYVSSLKQQLDLEYKDESNWWMPYERSDTLGSSRYLQILDAYEYLILNYPNPNIQTASLHGYAAILKNNFGNFDKADSLLNVLLKNYPLSPHGVDARFILTDIAIKENRMGDAENYLKQIHKSGRAKPVQLNRADFIVAKLRFWNADFGKALERLESIKDPSDNMYNDVLELKILITTFRNDSLNLSKYANADLLATQSNFAEASALFKSLSENKKLFILSDISLYKYASIQFAIENYNEGIKALNDLSDSDLISFYSDKALYLMAQAYQYGLNDLPKAADTYKKLLEKFPNSLYFDKSRQILLELNLNKS